MCLLSNDETDSSLSSSDEKVVIKRTKNLVDMLDDPVLEEYIRNYGKTK